MQKQNVKKSAVPAEVIQSKIYLIRGRKVMFDQDLAQMYGVLTKNLNKAVSRNLDRFPEDFMFQLTKEEIDNLRFQIGTSSWGGRRYTPVVFTELGVAMLSSVLKSRRAALVNISIMRTFVRMRRLLLNHKELAARVTALEHRLAGHDAALGEHAAEIRAVFAAIRRLMTPPRKPRPTIGFKPPEGG